MPADLPGIPAQGVMEALRIKVDIELVREFAQEALETLDQIEPGLVALHESGAGVGEDQEWIHRVFRAFHSMKGSAGFMNLTAIQRLNHESETLLDRVRGGKSALTRERAELLLRVCDVLRHTLERIGTEGHDAFAQADVDVLVQELRAELEGEAGAAAGLKAGAQAAPPPQVKAAPSAQMPPRQGARQALAEAQMLLELPPDALAVPETGQAIGDALALLREACATVGWGSMAEVAGRLARLMRAPDAESARLASAVLELYAPALRDERNEGDVPGLDALADLVTERMRAAGINDEEPEHAPAAPDGTTPRVPGSGRRAPNAAPQTEQAIPRVAAAVSEGATPRAPGDGRRDLSPDAPATPGSAQTPSPTPSTAAKPAARSSIRVDAERLDALVDLVGELIIAQSMLARFGAPARQETEGYEAATAQLSKITRDLQDLSMSLRMVPVATIFQRMTRLVHDTAAKLGKDVELVLQGQDTEVDKNVIEQLSDPLVHMLRNAVDHGMETPEERRQAGKPPKGRVVLQARQEGDEVRITVRDDGRGIDPQRVLKKAIERGLVHGDGAGMSRDAILRLIFEPGFSTAAVVTDVSGRGVGMDVVKRNVETLKGRVDIASTPGQGSAFTVRLPLTLAIIEGMRVRVGDCQYAIPMAAIREAVRVEQGEITLTVEGQELALVRGALYPVLRLHAAHGIHADHIEPWEGLLVLVEHQGRAFALLVDELLGHQQTVVKGLSPYLGPVPGVSGCSILGDGDVSLILDVGALASSAGANTLPN